MSKNCARCNKVVYNIEELKCLDKVSPGFYPKNCLQNSEKCNKKICGNSKKSLMANKVQFLISQAICSTCIIYIHEESES